MTSSFFSIASRRLLSPGCVSQLKRLIRYAACGGSPLVLGSCFFFRRLSRGGLTFCRAAPHLSCRSLGPNPAVDLRQELLCGSSQPPPVRACDRARASSRGPGLSQLSPPLDYSC